MERSEEIRRVVERWLAGTTAGDADAVLARLSEHPGTLMIGTDPDEWWQEDARAVWRRQIEEVGGFSLTPVLVDAWEESGVGWASAQVEADLPAATAIARLTCVSRAATICMQSVRAEQPTERCRCSRRCAAGAIGVAASVRAC